MSVLEIIIVDQTLHKDISAITDKGAQGTSARDQ